MTVGGETLNAAIATETGGANVHFATHAIFGDSNLLWQAVDYATERGEISADLKLSRNELIVAARNDMDQSQEYFEVHPEDGHPGIYDVMIPIVEEWHEQYGFVGSYYINVGDAPLDQMTDWAASKVYYDRLLEMGNEIGTHSYTHPHDTNALTPAEIAFEFDASAAVIATQLGINVTGAAVPGAPETIDTSHEIIQYFNYMTGGYAGIGAGYPGGFGYLDPEHTDKPYFAPNVSFDFSLVQFQGMTPEEASAKWAQEMAEIQSHASTPVALWPWHDYGPTEFEDHHSASGGGSPYTREMFDDFVRSAAEAGAEFVTLDDLAGRIEAHGETSFAVETTPDGLTVTAAGDDLGRLAVDLDLNGAEGEIDSVAGWYAYDADSVFLDRDGGTFEITLGTSQADVTHISSLDQRMELISLSGDGENLAFEIQGEGEIQIEMAALNGRFIDVQGASIASETDETLVLDVVGEVAHTIEVRLTETAPAANRAPIAADDEIALSTGDGRIEISGALLANDSDPDDGDTPHILSVEGGLGDVVHRGGEVFYDPAGRFDDLVEGETARDSFSYRVTDGEGGFATGVATLVVSGEREAATIFEGTDGNDVINGAGTRSKLSGEGGDDILRGRHDADDIYGGSGNDLLRGRGGADLLDGGEGDDQLFGNGGRDIFQFGRDFGEDSIEDYRDGVDRIDLTDFSFLTFAGLEIAQEGADTRIVVLDEGSILLVGVNAGVLDAGDFLF